MAWYYLPMPRRNPLNTEAHRQCGRCRQVLPRSEFGLNNQKKDRSLSYCRGCTSEIQKARYQERKGELSARYREVKAEVVQWWNGKCVRCGYDEFLAGLDFHHIGDDKEVVVSSLIQRVAQSRPGTEAYRLAYAAMTQEILKCTLLCRNCHMALHSGEWSPENPYGNGDSQK